MSTSYSILKPNLRFMLAFPKIRGRGFTRIPMKGGPLHGRSCNFCSNGTDRMKS